MQTLLARMRDAKTAEGLFIAEIANRSGQAAESHRSNATTVVAALIMMAYTAYIHYDWPHPFSWLMVGGFFLAGVACIGSKVTEKDYVELCHGCWTIAFFVWLIFIAVPNIFL